MIPAKIFLEAVRVPAEVNSKLVFNLVMNGIFYDEIKQFQTKYLCITSQDKLQIEVKSTDCDGLCGSAQIQQLYKLVLDRKTIQVKVKGQGIAVGKDVVLVFVVEPVAAFNRKQKEVQANPNRKDQVTLIQQYQMMCYSSDDISFSRKRQAQEGDYSPKHKQQNTKSGNVQNMAFERQLPDNDSLQSLAQQRQKILGELFGKFKRER